MKNDENMLIHSLNNTNNYNEKFVCDANVITALYAKIINEYLKLIEPTLKSKNDNLKKYILIRGIDTITNVFNKLIISTKNLNLTYWHCQKSYYSYIEFVSQIRDDEKMYLKLTTRDASVYVYKRSVSQVNVNFIKSSTELASNSKRIIQNTNVFINIYQTILLKIIKMWEINAYNLTQIVNDLCEISTYEKMSNIIDFIDELYSKVDDVPAFLKIVQLLITKINKNPILLKNKIVSNYNYEDLTIENCNNFVNNILE